MPLKSNKYEVVRSQSLRERTISSTLPKRKYISSVLLSSEDTGETGVYRKLTSSPSLYYKQPSINALNYLSDGKATFSDQRRVNGFDMNGVSANENNNRFPQRYVVSKIAKNKEFLSSNSKSTFRVSLSKEIFESLPESNVDSGGQQSFADIRVALKRGESFSRACSTVNERQTNENRGLNSTERVKQTQSLSANGKERILALTSLRTKQVPSNALITDTDQRMRQQPFVNSTLFVSKHFSDHNWKREYYGSLPHRRKSTSLVFRQVKEGTLFGLFKSATMEQCSTVECSDSSLSAVDTETKRAFDNRIGRCESQSGGVQCNGDNSSNSISNNNTQLIAEEQVCKEKCNSNNEKQHLKVTEKENTNRNSNAEFAFGFQSPFVVQEVMKKVPKIGSIGFKKRAMLCATKTSVNPMTVEEDAVIQELERSIAEGSRRQLFSANKSLRKDQRMSSGPPSIDQQTDNLVEEIYLSPEASSNGSVLSASPPKAVNSVAINDDSNGASVSSLDSGTSSHNQTHFVVVAIDFGTTYSGYAFSFTRDPSNIHMMRKWDGGGNPDIHNHKTPTTLLLNPDGEFDSFGFAARENYHNLSPKEVRRWLYFEKFKMNLHTCESLSLETEIKAANGKLLPALTVFAHALRYFKQHALQELSDQCGADIIDEDIRWVVTVPAIWKQPAKQFMRKAAYSAGMGSPNHADQLLIALEPEAASIYCRRLRLNQLIPDSVFNPNRKSFIESANDSKSETIEKGATNTLSSNWQLHNHTNQAFDDVFTKGTRYMVVDCGGGTVDITVHEIQDKQGSLKELHKATGGPFGSVGVDEQFETLLENIFTKDFMDHFKNKFSTGFADLMTTFEARKRSATTNQSTSYNIMLPFSFVSAYKKFRGHSVESAVKKFENKDITYCNNVGMLRVQPSLMQTLFRSVTTEIVKHIQSIVTHPNAKGVQYLFLVGGFAESQILQSSIRSSFADKLKVIIPQGVSLAILRGAVLFGLDPNVINVRRLPMTYGIGVVNRFDCKKHPLAKKIVRDSIEWCGDIFDKFVSVDESVGVGDVVTRSYTPLKDGQRYTVLHIYCSERDDITFITDEGVKRCGTLVLDLDDSGSSINSLTRSDGSFSASIPIPKVDTGQSQRREIETKMTFGDTEIKVMAIDLTSGKTVKAEVDFLS